MEAELRQNRIIRNGSIQRAAGTAARNVSMGVSEDGAQTDDRTSYGVIDTGRMVNGYLFQTPEDAEKARVDIQKIAFLQNRFKTGKVSEQKAIYEKAIENKIFRTPIGWNYLAAIRDRIVSAGVDEDSLLPIPVDVVITRTPLADDYIPKQRVKPAPPKRDIHYMTIISVAINIILVIMVVVMFLVAWYSETDNILNYKANVTNRYAEWQQELTERERTVRQKERELGMQADQENQMGSD